MQFRGGRAGEIVQSKSPAEFFAENQNIAGFDNPGKSLYTTVRELVENSLDAAESIEVLPEITLTIEELTEGELNQLRGVESRERVDLGLFKASGKGANARSSSVPEISDEKIEGGAGSESASLAAGGKPSSKQRGKKGERSYYRVRCEDNGCGMAHDRIPDMLGRVLSGSKYGVRQTRGKFGLGSKMALIWSKKSTGLPIEIESSHATDPSRVPSFMSRCILDIDIYRNQPAVKLHEKVANEEGWRGARIDVVVEGNWTTYKTYIMNYLQQLAIITPYAQIELTFRSTTSPDKDFITRYARRSDQMPPPSQEVKYHPSSVNHLIIQQLLKRTKSKTIVSFLANELACVNKDLAIRIIKELGSGFKENLPPQELDNSMSIQLTTLLKSVSIFKPPDGACLSPAGEYNLRLGIMKELHPDYVATVSEQAAAFEGHPFVVEAGVSLGGPAIKDGINIYRFANRIPLLFEVLKEVDAGNDVVTQVVNRRINWANYKIDPKKDRIGVFVSIVSTKIPFKGTGKEYIGDDIEEIRKFVKSALQRCCKQLKQHLVTRNAQRDIKERKKNLLRYTPDVSRAIATILNGVNKRKRDPSGSRGPGKDERQKKLFKEIERKWQVLEGGDSTMQDVIKEANDASTLDKKLKTSLESAIEKVDLESALEAAAIDRGGAQASKEAFFVTPLQAHTNFTGILSNSVCSIRFFSSALVTPSA